MFFLMQWTRKSCGYLLFRHSLKKHAVPKRAPAFKRVQ